MITAVLTKSPKPEKRFKVIVEDDKKKKTIHFGSGKPTGKGAFIDHKSPKIKDAWIARHKVRGTFDNPFSASFWSANLLWNKETLEDSIDDIEKKYNIEIN